MTTKNSPPRVLKAQSDKIAKTLKSALTDPRFDEARQKETFKAAVAMDDKILVIELAWDVIRDSTELSLSEYVLKRMQEKRDDA